MKFLIAGAGAIGGYVGARMANAGFDVTLFARGPHLVAMQSQGVRVKSTEGDFEAHPKVAGSLDEVHVYHPQPYYDPTEVVFGVGTPGFFESEMTDGLPGAA